MISRARRRASPPAPARCPGRRDGATTENIGHAIESAPWDLVAALPGPDEQHPGGGAAPAAPPGWLPAGTPPGPRRTPTVLQQSQFARMLRSSATVSGSAPPEANRRPGDTFAASTSLLHSKEAGRWRDAESVMPDPLETPAAVGGAQRGPGGRVIGSSRSSSLSRRKERTEVGCRPIKLIDIAPPVAAGVRQSRASHQPASASVRRRYAPVQAPPLVTRRCGLQFS